MYQRHRAPHPASFPARLLTAGITTAPCSQTLSLQASFTGAMLHGPLRGIRVYFRLCASGPRAAISQKSRHPQLAGRQRKYSVFRLAQGAARPRVLRRIRDIGAPTSASLAARRFTRRLACIGRYQSPDICSLYRWPRRSLGVGRRDPGPTFTVTSQLPPGARVGLAPAAAQSRTGAGPHTTSPRCSRTRPSHLLLCPDG